MYMKFYQFLIIVLIGWGVLAPINLAAKESESTVIQLQNGKFMAVQVCSDNIVRIRLSDKNSFSESLMERYEVVKTDWAETEFSKNMDADQYRLATKKFALLVDCKDGRISVKNPAGNPIIEQLVFHENTQPLCAGLKKSFSEYFINPKRKGAIIGDVDGKVNEQFDEETGSLEKSSLFEISLKDTELFYGGGSSSRKTIQHRGTALRTWASYQRSESSMPFLMSSSGWGIFNNVTFRNYFDIGRFQEDKLFVYNTDGEIDFYLMFGRDMVDVLDLYTTITGKPYLLPKWAYGLAFGSNTLENQFNVLDNANRFRQEEIPCDIYWLEPQWMKQNYDFSTKKEWNLDRFQNSYYWLRNPKDPKATNLFVRRMKDLGFKMALWLCIDHDLSIEEEDYLAKKSGKPESGLEHWFPHLNKFVDEGIAGFKLDPGRTLDEHPDRKYHNGKTDAEMHNVNQVLLQKQMYRTFREHTGLRSFHHYCGGYAGSQRWGASTVGDNGGHIKSLYDVINHSFSGNPNMSIDALENVVVKAPGIHYSFFIPWVQVNSWAWLLHPWYYNQRDKDMFRFYAQLRYSLMPYIYSAAINSSLTGQPIAWPMALAFPDEPKVAGALHQYMFGENLLVGAYTNSVYLPAGQWIDYWTGNRFQGKQLVKCDIPEDRGGPLFIKAGAIIPYQFPKAFIEETAADSLILKIYPHNDSDFTLLEDDGISYGYTDGKYSEIKFQCLASGKKIDFVINPVQGFYEGMPVSRQYKLEFFIDQKPKKILLNNKKIDNWEFIKSGKLVIRHFQTDLTEKQHITIL
ncbi:TIM-barrel domain-containing protein [Gaoshiqia sp. Z1-71]|uniref:glycoside hydrolase family 31 protein n=1 Tax=Gaoshiqia hydrogeniformans TaxID=3290090 RepID=UPI003BF8E863